MTRKHFNALARELLQVRPPADARDTVKAQWFFDVQAVARVCATANTGFERQRFYTACGLEPGYQVYL
jgi:hypothetical protein